MQNDLPSQPLIAKQLVQLQQLNQLLSDEKAILQLHNPEKLTILTQQKNNLLLAIQSLDDEIGKNTQFAHDKANGLFIEELLDIKKLLASCQQKNLMNGQIIQQSQLSVERLKTSLLENHNKSSVTYDSKGKKAGGLNSLNLKA